MPSVWLIIVFFCSRITCVTEVDGIFTDRTMCLNEADRLSVRYPLMPGFMCQPVRPKLNGMAVEF